MRNVKWEKGTVINVKLMPGQSSSIELRQQRNPAVGGARTLAPHGVVWETCYEDDLMVNIKWINDARPAQDGSFGVEFFEISTPESNPLSASRFINFKAKIEILNLLHTQCSPHDTKLQIDAVIGILESLQIDQEIYKRIGIKLEIANRSKKRNEIANRNRK
jgi:hypothetical protein